MATTIPFGEWLPDQPPTGLSGATIATNVIADINHYKPFPSLVTFSTALGSRCKGSVTAVDPAGNAYDYVGDSSALYSLVGTSFGPVTRSAGDGGAYTVADEDYWEFASWGNTIIGVNGFVDLPQQISLGAATFANLSTGVKAKHIAVMRDFVVLGNVSDSATNIYRIRWSAINNPTSWTPDAATLADFQDLLPEGGPIQRIVGGEYGVVFQKHSIWRMQFVGSPLVFQFDRVHNSVGTYAPQSVIRYQNLVFFLAEDGFYAFDGSQLTPIGRNKIDNFFRADLAVVALRRINALVDPTRKLVMWAYPSNNNINSECDKLIIYNWAVEKWTLVEGLQIELLLQSLVTGYTLEGLDAISTSIDNPSLLSFDSSQWTGGQLILAAFDTSHRLSRFNGSAMAATVETGEFQLFPGIRATIYEIRPLLDGVSASATVTVMNRNNLTESVSAGSAPLSPNATGFVPVRVGARYFRMRLRTGASTEFTHLLGVEVDGVPDGPR